MKEELLIAKLNMIADQIKHEDNLIGARTTWLVISQSFLFGAFVALVGQIGGVSAAAHLAKLLFIVIPLLGVLLPVLILLAMGAATYAIKQWRVEIAQILEMPEAKELDWPRLKHWRLVTWLGNLLPVAASVGFLLAWIVIMIKIGMV